jgi:hypothetical protein
VNDLHIHIYLFIMLAVGLYVVNFEFISNSVCGFTARFPSMIIAVYDLFLCVGFRCLWVSRQFVLYYLPLAIADIRCRYRGS